MCVRGGSRIFFRRGCTRLLLYFNTNKPHFFFFCRIPVVLEKRRSSQGGGGVRTTCTLPLDPPLCVIGYLEVFWCTYIFYATSSVIKLAITQKKLMRNWCEFALCE